MSSDDFLNREAIDPSILLHKLIDENDEIGAIKLIEKERGKINVNYEFNQRVPIFSAINNKMYKLFDTIVNCEGFDSKIEDGFGETLFESLLYLSGSDEVNTSKEDNALLKSMIKSILSSKTFDFNAKDLNNDTAINVACEYPNELWVVEALVSKKSTDINVINDFDCSAIDNCIRNKNMEALKLLGQRPDLVIREETKKLAKECGINLDEYIKPTKSIYGKYVVESDVAKTEDVLEYELTRA
jgi:ankyrin repeat protein